MSDISDWIPTNKKLPNKDMRVLICNSGGGRYIAEYKNYFGQMEFLEWCNLTESWHIFSDIIAWQPLPKPYNEVKL